MSYAGEFKRVTPTPEEVAEYKRKHQGSAPGVYRLECYNCGTRIWGSGIGIGSHRRRKGHRVAMPRLAE